MAFRVPFGVQDRLSGHDKWFHALALRCLRTCQMTSSDSSDSPNRRSATLSGHRLGGTFVTLLILLVLAAGIGFGGYVLLGDDGGDVNVAKLDAEDIHTVARSSFDIIIPASGELTTERKIEIRNRLEGRAMITEIVGEGNSVKAGDILLKLADDEIIDKIKDGEDKVKTAESAVIAAEQTLAIRRSTMESDLQKADLEIEIAQLAMKAWEEGDLVTNRQTNDIHIETAKINRDRLKKRFQEAKSLVENGFISNDEYEQDRIQLIESEAMVKSFELAKDVYERYTIKKERAEKESAVEQSNAEKGRTKQRHMAEIVKIEADVESAKFKLDTATERLADLREQLDACVITAPGDGLVVYASSMSGERRGRGDEPPPQVGTELRQNELVMVLPDTNRMIANLKVGEALSGRIRPGQQTVVYSDSSPDQPVAGRVIGVSVLAESGGWRDPNRRDYTVKVGLDVDPSMGLKPSMRCRGEIVLGRVDEVINIPIQAVFRKGPLAFVYVPENRGYAQRRVDIGQSSEMSVEIRNGLAVGEKVLLRRPTAGEVMSELEMPESMGGTGGRFAGPSGGWPGGSKSGGASGGMPGSGKPSELSGGGKPSGIPAGRRPGGIPGGGKPSSLDSSDRGQKTTAGSSGKPSAVPSGAPKSDAEATS